MPHTLLLADDSVTIQRVIQLTFADQDIAVVSVNDGDEAIVRLSESVPDIVLVDSGMPGRSGYEVARHIKSTPALAHIPVLLLAGAFEAVDPQKVEAAGCDGVLTKPFEPQVVVQRVRELLGREGAPRVSPSFVPITGDVAPEPPPMFGDIVAEEPALAIETANPAEMSVALDSPPPVVESFMSEAIDRGFEAGEPAPADAVLPGTRTTPDGQLDDYFDQLDRAIAARVTEQAVRPVAPEAPAAPEPVPTPEAPVMPSDRPMLADAFSALLAAEESETADPVMAMQALIPRAPVVIAPPMPAVPPTIVVSEEIVEKVVRRVLEEMTGRALRDTVVEVTAATAERLVLEEIARIKSNIP